MRLVTIVLVGALALAGCEATSGQESAALGVTADFLTAAATGDGAAACADLAPDTLAELERSSGEPCADAVLDEDLPEPQDAEDTAVYGQWARVRFADQAVFLAMFPGGWRVAAAGCHPRGEKPYECDVDGG
jgi:hypothetical protein